MALATGATAVGAPGQGTVPGLRILAREREVLGRCQASSAGQGYAVYVDDYADYGNRYDNYSDYANYSDYDNYEDSR